MSLVVVIKIMKASLRLVIITSTEISLLFILSEFNTAKKKINKKKSGLMTKEGGKNIHPPGHIIIISRKHIHHSSSKSTVWCQGGKKTYYAFIYWRDSPGQYLILCTVLGMTYDSNHTWQCSLSLRPAIEAAAAIQFMSPVTQLHSWRTIVWQTYCSDTWGVTAARASIRVDKWA